MARDEPGRPDPVVVEELQQAGRPDLAGEHAPRDVVRRVLAAVRAEPARDRVDVDAVRAQDLLGHAVSFRRRFTTCPRHLSPLAVLETQLMCALCGVLMSEHWAEAGEGRRARVFRVGC